MNSVIDLFTFIGVGVVIGLVLGLGIAVTDVGTHPVVTGMVVGAATGVSILLIPHRRLP